MEDANAQIRIALRGEYTQFAGMDRLTGDIGKIRSHFTKLWNSGPLGKATAAADVGMAIAVPVVALGIESTKAAVKVDTAQKRIGATYTLSQRTMATYQDFIEKNSAKLLQSQTTMWAGIGQAVSQGFGPQMTQSLVTGAAKVATVFNTTLAEGIKPAAIAFKDFGIQAKQVPASFDLMARAASKVQGGWNALYSGPTSRVLNLAAASGLSLADTLSAAVTAAQRTGGGRAMGAIGSIIASIDKMQGGEQSLRSNGLIGTIQGIIREYGNNQKDLSKALGGGQNLIIAEGLAQSGGANLGTQTLQGMFGPISNTLPKQFKRMQLSMEDMEVTLGRGLIPLLTQFVGIVSPILNATSAWVQHNQALAGTILKVGLGVGAVSAALRIGLALVPAFRFALLSLEFVMANGSIMLVVIALAALTYGLIKAYQHVGWFRAGVNLMGKDVTNAFLHPAETATNVLTWFRQHWVEGLFITTIGPFGLVVTYLTRTFAPNLFTAVTDVFNRLQSWLSSTWAGIYGKLILPFQTILAWIALWPGKFVGAMIAGLTAAYDKIPGPIRQLLNLVSTPLRNFGSWVYTAGKTVAQNLANGLQDGAGAIARAMNGLTSFATGATSGNSSAGITSPAMLAAVRRQEDNPNYGVAGGGETQAKNYLRYWYNWTGTGAGQAAMRAHGLNPSSEIDRERVTLAIYNSGPNAPWWQSYYSASNDQNSVNPSSTMKPGWDARGMLYANDVLRYAGVLGGVTPVAQVPQGSPGPSGAPGSVSTGPGPMPTLAANSTVDHTGQADWYLDASGTWRHVSPPHVSNYTWDASSNQWVPTATYTKEQHLSAATRVAQATLRADRATWQGVNPLNIPATGNHGLNQSMWLKDEYQINRLGKTIADNNAELMYLRGALGTGRAASERLGVILERNTEAYNTANQRDYARLHPLAAGAANHVQSVRIDGYCAAQATANVHRKKTSAAVQAAAHAADDIRAEVKAIVRKQEQQNAWLLKLAALIAGNATGGAGQFADDPLGPRSRGAQSPLPAHGH